jgi:SAM-dependent methyltransferase
MKNSIFFNSFYIIRKRLIDSIKNNSHYLSGKVLDFGCGNKPYEKLINSSEYIGIDILDSGHDNSEKKADFFYDGKSLPFPNQEFDSIISSEVFEHVFNLDIILKELNRVLKKNGHILITIPFVWELHEKPFDYARYTIYGIESLLKENNFEVIKSERTTNYVETITQLKAVYLSKIFYTRNGKLNGILNLIFIFPIMLFGIIISKILPKNNDLYHNNIIVAKKTN